MRIMTLVEGHPLTRGDDNCASCRKDFEVGDRIVLVPLGPGDDPEAQKAHAEGRLYNAAAAVVHAKCAGAER